MQAASFFAAALMLVGAVVASPPAIAQSTFAIDGLEVTQSVQHYKSSKHLRDRHDYDADNSIPLIAGKTTYIRAYVRRLSGAAVPIVGTLTVERQTGSGWTAVTTIESVRAVTPRIQPGYRTQRGDLARTLNFVLPGPQVEGALRFTATARLSGNTTVVEQSQVSMPTALRRTLRVAVVRIGYKGPSDTPGRQVITVPPPEQGVFETVVPHTIAAFPVSDLPLFRDAGTLTLDQPLLTDAAANSVGAPMRVLRCPEPWSTMIQSILERRHANGNPKGWLYYGLIANEVPHTSNTVGCGGGGPVGVGKVNRPLTITHELGHAAGQNHVKSPPPPTCDRINAGNSYPIYEKTPSGSYRRGSIGEYGLDTRTGVVKSPLEMFDMMTYCRDNRWISPYTYGRLIKRKVFYDLNVGVSDVDDYPYQPHTIITAVLQQDGVLENASVMELTTRAEPIGSNLSDFRAELVDATGRVVASAPVQSTSLREGSDVPESGTPECTCIVEAFLPQGGSGSRVRILRGSQVLFESERRAAASLVAGLQAVPSQDGVVLTWSGIAADQEVWIRLSDDGGKTWAMLDVGVHPNRSYRIARDRVPGSRPLLFEVLAFDAAETHRAVSPELRLPSK